MVGMGPHQPLRVIHIFCNQGGRNARRGTGNDGIRTAGHLNRRHHGLFQFQIFRAIFLNQVCIGQCLPLVTGEAEPAHALQSLFFFQHAFSYQELQIMLDSAAGLIQCLLSDIIQCDIWKIATHQMGSPATAD